MHVLGFGAPVGVDVPDLVFQTSFLSGPSLGTYRIVGSPGTISFSASTGTLALPGYVLRFDDELHASRSLRGRGVPRRPDAAIDSAAGRTRALDA